MRRVKLILTGADNNGADKYQDILKRSGWFVQIKRKGVERNYWPKSKSFFRLCRLLPKEPRQLTFYNNSILLGYRL